MTISFLLPLRYSNPKFMGYSNEHSLTQEALMKLLKNRRYLTYFLLILLSSSLLAACATSAKYKQMLDNWHGKNINQFISAWGYPTRTMKAPNGNTVYIYQHRQLRHFPAYRTPNYTSVSTKNGKTTITQTGGQYFPGSTYRFNCTTWVEFNKKHIIIRTLFRGNDCTA